MVRFVKAGLCPFIALAALLGQVAVARAQILVPPSLLQKQAERDHRADDSPTPKNPTQDQAQRIESLRATALGDDSAASLGAIRQLRAMGAGPARAALREAVEKLLERDWAVFGNIHALSSASELRQLSDQIADERKATRANIDKLSHNDDSIPTAHKHYDSLKANWGKLHDAVGQADQLGQAVVRHGELLTMWHDLMPGDRRYADQATIKAAASVDRTFGFSTSQLAAADEAGQKAPAEPVLRDLYFYRICRRIAAYNTTVATCMTAGEQENFQCLNTYREYLGILPYEIDPRLVQAARDHSQEMVTLGYFAHESPVPANKSPWDRIGKTGYPAGSGENIAMGVHSGEKAFWMWFDSPGHHQNMASLGSTAMGVGNIGIHWTQDMGSAPRLMQQSAEARKQALGTIKPAPKST